MSEQPQDPVEKAYADAFSGRGPEPEDLPAHAVESEGGEPIEQIEQRARKELERVQKLRGKSELEDDPAPQAQSEAPPAKQPTEEQPREQLAPDDAVNLLLGYEPEEPEQLSPEEQAERAERELISGEAAARAVEADREYQAALDQVIERSPGITSDEFIEAATPAYRRIEAAYGEDYAEAHAPEILEDLYSRTGGAQRWGELAQHKTMEAAYTHALTGGGPRDEFGFPVESDEAGREF
jgi:hypothetical protein